MVRKRVLLGNEAIGRGLVEGGCQVMTSYPGTPATEILPAVIAFREEEGLDIYVEWSTNEKVAYEVALAAAYAGKRAAVAMKQVGLNVASDPFFSSVYTGVKGGFVVVVADDPGPYSSQTEQDSRLWGILAKVPVLDPCSPQEAKEMASFAFELSERYEIPVLLRPTLRICHARQTVTLNPPKVLRREAHFVKDPHRWASTPRYRYQLHKVLNRKLEEIAEEYENSPFNGVLLGRKSLESLEGSFRLGIITAGSTFGTIVELLEELGLADSVPVLKVGAPLPFPRKLVERFMKICKHVLVLEEPDAVLEFMIRNGKKVEGRFTGVVPKEGELSPEVVEEAFRKAWEKAKGPLLPPIRQTVKPPVEGAEKPPVLCPGCPHRASFYAIKRAFPNAIFPSDIGCYTLGVNQGAVDIVLDMGAAINMAAGLYQAYHQDKREIPIVATIGDSTFFHAGLPALVNAVHTRARFLLVILDNSTTAMTGMQPTAASPILADGEKAEPITLERIVKACGVQYLQVVDPYKIPELIKALRNAQQYVEKNGGVAVIVARHPCMEITKKVDQPRRVEIFYHLPLPEREVLRPRYVTKTPPCNGACPVGTDVERVLFLLAKEKREEAASLLLQTNPLPSVCGRVCFHPCENACNRGKYDQPVSIQAIERFLGDTLQCLPKRAPDTGFRVAVIGSGPAGLSCAYHLALLGHKVTIFEAMPEPGGLLRYGIPPYRLPKEVLRREIDRILSLGIEMRTGVKVGRDISFKDLHAFDALFFATGAQKPRSLEIPNERLKGVWRGIEFLKSLNEGNPPVIGKRVAVIGGGNTAIDVCRSLIRLGAQPLLLYRRRKEDMPAHPSEVEEALAEGVKMEFLVSPVEILGDEEVKGLRLVRMYVESLGKDDRSQVKPVEGSEFVLEVEAVVVAIGEEPDLELPSDLRESGKVFFGGDLLDQPRTVAHAIGSGRKGALEIHRFLTGEEIKLSKERVPKEVPLGEIDITAFPRSERTSLRRLSSEEARRSFEEISKGISEEEALREAKERCFHCGSCTECDFCMISCPQGAILKEGSTYKVNLELCNLCRLCAVACPRSVIEMPIVESCVGCRYCLEAFGCPALRMVDGHIEIDRKICVDCGLCVYACNQGAIREVR